ncbi:MAG: leucine-rich repeat domain-containing protein [Ruminococcaceae bacterium]|nr:leucine-rich repeat domain-containing protein [Oscillospiraceae bacterium]
MQIKCYIKTKHIWLSKLTMLLLWATALVFIFSGCVYDKNPSIKTPGFVDEISNSSTPQSSQNIVKPTVNPDLSTSQPYDPVINFTDPYFESVVRDMIGKSIGDITVSDVSGIKTIKARVKGIRNISDIVYFSSLEELDLYGNKINDITPLGQLFKLRVLNIGKNYNTLYSGNSAGLNLNVLSSLPLLEELYAEDNQISDITFVEGLMSLRVLDLSNNGLTDVTSLSKITNLETLIVSKNKLTDLSSVAECSKLAYIDASGNYYEVMDDETYFYTGYGIKDLSFTKKLSNLSYINVSMNMVTSLDPLAKLTSLRSLYADDNYITDIGCLKSNPNIQLLSVRRNYIKDFSVVTGMKALTELFYVGNPVADAAPLKNFELQNQ